MASRNLGEKNFLSANLPRTDIDRSVSPPWNPGYNFLRLLYPFNTAYKQLIFMHKHRVWRIPFLKNEQPIVSKINILNTHEQPLFISIKNIYIFLFLCRKHFKFFQEEEKKVFPREIRWRIKKKEKKIKEARYFLVGTKKKDRKSWRRCSLNARFVGQLSGGDLSGGRNRRWTRLRARCLSGTGHPRLG